MVTSLFVSKLDMYGRSSLRKKHFLFMSSRFLQLVERSRKWPPSSFWPRDGKALGAPLAT